MRDSTTEARPRHGGWERRCFTRAPSPSDRYFSSSGVTFCRVASPRGARGRLAAASTSGRLNSRARSGSLAGVSRSYLTPKPLGGIPGSVCTPLVILIMELPPARAKLFHDLRFLADPHLACRTLNVPNVLPFHERP